MMIIKFTTVFYSVIYFFLFNYQYNLFFVFSDNIHLAKAPKISDQIVTDKHGKRR